MKMVVDMELENAKKSVLSLMNDRDKIESELNELKTVLQANNIGMNEPLVDSEGFPRADIDVYRVRHARQKIICLQNDYKALMKKIEEGLIYVHSIVGNDSLNEPSTARQKLDSQTSSEHELFLEPFLRVNLVSPGSPAELDGFQMNDLIIKFGSITSQNFRVLKDIGDLVQQNCYKPIEVIVKRVDSKVVSFHVTPRRWSGKGLLGCNTVPIEVVEK